MERKQFEPATLAYIRVNGPYGENYEQAIDRLYQWAGAEGVADDVKKGIADVSFCSAIK